MELIKWGRTSTGETWGIAEDDYAFWLVVGRTVFDVQDKIYDGAVSDCFPNYTDARNAADEL